MTRVNNRTKLPQVFLDMVEVDRRGGSIGNAVQIVIGSTLALLFLPIGFARSGRPAICMEIVRFFENFVNNEINPPQRRRTTI